MIRCDAVVAGAGPAGACAATVLAQAGWDVTLADALSAAPRRFGESVPPAALRLLRELRVDISAFGGTHKRIGGNIVYWSGNGDVADFLTEPDGAGWLICRSEFNKTLQTAAVSSGASVVSSPVQTLSHSGNGWVLETASGVRIACRWLIDATGRSSAIARRLGASRIRDEKVVALAGLGTCRVELNRTLIEAVPEGWWYAAALPDGAAVAILHTEPDESQALRCGWHAALERTSHVRDFFPPESFPSSACGFAADAGGSYLDRVWGDSWIACGDAAIAFDPLSSQGIYTAMYSGRAAAKAILDGTSSIFAEYAGRLSEIRRISRIRLRALYEEVTQWEDKPFWAARRSANGGDAGC
jgi:flavin-dependent dehydrogenase